MRTPAWPRLLPALILGAAAILACGSGGDDIRKVGIGSYRSEGDSPRTEGLLDHDHEVVVPPDRATVAVRVSVDRTSMAAAASALRSAVATVQAATGDHCTLSWVDATPAARTGDERWVANADLRVDIDFAGLNDVPLRLDRVDTCLQALEPTLTWDGSREVPGGSDWVARSHPIYSLTQPEASYPLLVARLDEGLRRAALVSGAPQWAPGEWRCVPTGNVSIGTARVSGVVVQAEVNCRVDGAPPGPVVASGD